MEHRAVTTISAPPAIGPYSQAVVAGEYVFCSGQVGADPVTGELVPGGVEAEASQAIKNLAAVLESAGSSLHKVVKTTVFMTDLAGFQAMNAVYAAAFGKNHPARATVQVAALPRKACVEIEAIAVL